MKATKILSLIAAKSQQNRKEKFTSLAHLLDEEMLVDCFSTLNRKKAVGSDCFDSNGNGGLDLFSSSGFFGDAQFKTCFT